MADSIAAEFDGIAFELSRDGMGDMDMLEHLYALESADGLADAMRHIVPLARMLFGDAQWASIKDELRGRGGDEPHFAVCTRFLFGALDAAAEKARGDLKN